ncbi:hypothetical protein IFM89_014014 [Coptis chinensis]|uniref:Alpha-N-acetylglucosaminidase n=1 Tax=Coptis chinensis TaxID=261450 RepID=A0A835INZ6_9MAGN|nr:hypothetical protein IFM89_014014 [Coptis chinensis]
MQGWLFTNEFEFWKPPQMRALLHSVPFGKMIVLDLSAEVRLIWEKSSQFYGTPYVWCILHNFGGNIEMYGILDVISSGPVEARISQNSTMLQLSFFPARITLLSEVALPLCWNAIRISQLALVEKSFSFYRPLEVGVGMCMEGIEQNPVVFELMSEMAFRSEKVQLEELGQKVLKGLLLTLPRRDSMSGTQGRVDNVVRQYKTKQNKLHDYANKFWSGLLEGYYLPQTSTYFDYLLTSVRRNESFKLEEWKTEWISFSNKWQSGTELYPVQAKATPLLFQKHCLRNTSVEILGT